MMVTIMLLTASVAAPPALAFDRGARITKDGLGRVHVGMTVAQVERANRRPIDDLNDNAGSGGCSTATLGRRVYGLFTGDLLTRIYISTRRYRTRTGIHVGSTAAEVRRRYGRRVHSAPHAYVPNGLYLTVTTGHRRLLFETSTAGRVTSISTGRIPEVDYVEGCA